MPRTAPALIIKESGEQPPVLAGPPTALSGSIKLHNPGTADVVLREAGLRDPEGVLRLPAARQRLHPHVLRPDQQSSLELTIALDPATPSGEYRAELALEGRELPVRLLVAEVVDARVEPNTVVVFNHPGTPQRRRLLVNNTGNVAFTLGDPGPVELRIDGREDVVRVAVDDLLNHDRAELEGLLVALLAVGDAERRRSGKIDVRIPAGPVELEPGERAFIELEVTLTDEVVAHQRHRGRFPVLTRNVSVVVVPVGGRPPEREGPLLNTAKRTRARKVPERTPPPRGRRRRRTESNENEST